MGMPLLSDMTEAELESYIGEMEAMKVKPGNMKFAINELARRNESKEKAEVGGFKRKGEA